MKITVGQCNFTVADVDGNVSQILAVMDAAKAQHSELVVFPELALCGYPAEDLLLRSDFLQRCALGLEKICQAAKGIAVILGCPRQTPQGLRNAAVVIAHQSIVHEYYKQCLPNYGVFDEQRYFVAGRESLVFRLNPEGPAIGLLICEDTWFTEPALKAKAQGAEILISIHASPFAYDKEPQRQAVYQRCCQLTHLPMLCCQTVGAQDDLVFDGGSKAFTAEGGISGAAAHFETQLWILDYQPQQQCFVGSKAEDSDVVSKMYQALVLGIRDYVNKNGFDQVYLGLSGGIDSSLTLALAVDALGLARVNAVSMPSRFTSPTSYALVAEQVRLLPVNHQEVSIEPVFEAALASLAPCFDSPVWDKTEENLQARARGLLLMAMANKHQAMVLNTSNKSEMAVGYSTLYGDMVGGFAALKDVPKMWVFRLARYRNSVQQVIPPDIIDRPPSAELAPNQKDEDSLPPYERLDAIIERFVDQRQSIEEMVEAGFERAEVVRMVKLILQNEYKRRQAPPGVKVSARAFARERRYPMTAGAWWKA